MQATIGTAEQRLAAMEWAKRPLTERIAEKRDTLVKVTGRFAESAASKWAIGAIALMVAVLALLIPYPAFGFGLDDVVSGINGFFVDAFREPALWGFENAVDLMKDITPDNIVTGTFDGMIGTSQYNVAWYIMALGNGTIKSVANTILSVTALLKLLDIVKRMDQQGGTIPAVREVLTFFTFFVIASMCVNKAPEIMRALFTALQAIPKNINTFLGDGATWAGMSFKLDDDIAFGNLLILMLLGLFYYLFALVVSVIVQFMGISRALEIYIMTMFSPIPFSFLTYDGTRQWGAGYIRSFLAVCLSGAILILGVWLFPLTLASFASGTEMTLDLKTSAWFVEAAACLLVLLSITLKSGSLASKILGGA